MEKIFIESAGLLVEVKIVEKKEKFGFQRYLVVPVAGSGEKWVNEESLLKPADIKKVLKNDYHRAS